MYRGKMQEFLLFGVKKFSDQLAEKERQTTEMKGKSPEIWGKYAEKLQGIRKMQIRGKLRKLKRKMHNWRLDYVWQKEEVRGEDI